MTDLFKKEPDYQVAEVNRMQELFQTGRLGRREFLQGLLAVGLTIATAGAVLTGTRDVQAATPKKGGHLRVGWDQHGPADTLDPALFTATIDYARGRMHCNNLLQFNNDMSLRPELAEEYEVNANATEFTFRLRQGVTFHDGKDLTVEDVIYSMNRHLGEDSISKAKSLVSMVSEWKKIDDRTVKAVLSSPNADLPAILATFHFKVLQEGADQKENYFNKVIGTGPFTVEEYTPGVRSISNRNPNYWRDDSGPYLDSLEIFGITDNVARVNALISGDIQLMGNLDAKAIKQVESSGDNEVFSVESGAFVEMVAMMDRAPGNNRDFVLGMKYLQQRDRMVRTLMKGQGVIANDHSVGPSYADHCKELPQRPFDLDKAKFHFKKSGITEAEVHTAEVGPGAVDMCLIAQANASKIGFNLNVKRVPGDGYWGAVWMNTPLCISSWNMRPTANTMLTLQYSGAWNESVFNNARFEQLLVDSRAETDEAKRRDMYCEMQRIVSDEAGTIIPYHRNYVDAKAKNVMGLPRVPLASFGGAEFPEFVWLA